MAKPVSSAQVGDREMRVAFALYKYFPFGGLQRNMVSIAQACQERGHSIKVYTCDWQGPVPDGFEIELFDLTALTNHNRNIKFARLLSKRLGEEPADIVVGFNKIPGIDLYYAADPCFAAKAFEDRSVFYRLTPRARHALDYEKQVFEASAHSHVLLVSEREKEVFRKYYGTQEHRFHVLPPGINRDRIAPQNADEIRRRFRLESGVADDEKLLLSLGSGFKTKGVDRTLKALKALPQAIRNKTRLFVIGQDNPKPFQLAARALGITDNVSFFAGRDDVPSILLGADLLVHPAYRENTGNVLLEAMVAGLPVITTDACGYAHYVRDAEMGTVIESPFNQQKFNHALQDLLEEPKLQWQQKGQAFANDADIYRRPQHAANIIEQLRQNNAA